MQLVESGPLWTNKSHGEDVVLIATNHLDRVVDDIDLETTGCFAKRTRSIGQSHTHDLSQMIGLRPQATSNPCPPCRAGVKLLVA